MTTSDTRKLHKDNCRKADYRCPRGKCPTQECDFGLLPFQDYDHKRQRNRKRNRNILAQQEQNRADGTIQQKQLEQNNTSPVIQAIERTILGVTSKPIRAEILNFEMALIEDEAQKYWNMEASLDRKYLEGIDWASLCARNANIECLERTVEKVKILHLSIRSLADAVREMRIRHDQVCLYLGLKSIDKWIKGNRKGCPKFQLGKRMQFFTQRGPKFSDTEEKKNYS